MKKTFILIILFISTVFVSCVSLFRLSVSKSDFKNFDIGFEKTEKPYELKVTISGEILDSALSIESYKIRYEKNKVFIDIDRKIKNTGISMDYYIQFLMNTDVKEIYIGKDLFWTSSVKSYFKSKGFRFPLNINKKNDYKYPRLGKNSELSDKEKKDIEKFIKYISKNISLDICNNWNEKAVGFDLSRFGIYEDSGKKYLFITVYAYFENSNSFDRMATVDKTAISILHNILTFDYDTYEELGWIF